ncbi:MAG: sigma-70 family RNA polymerase sigma factor [Kofleriaceae bacterium]
MTQGDLDAAEAKWPGVRVDRDRFGAFVAERGDESLHVADLYLVCACLDGNTTAIAAFHRELLGQLPRLLHRQRPDMGQLDELAQIIATKLLVERRLEQYSGRGPLLTWIKVVASRALSNTRRSANDRAALEDRAAAEPEVVATIDPELALIRQRFGIEFKDALKVAFASLELRERNLLRLHFVDRLGIDALAPIFSVSRATAARHLAAARTTLTERVVANLGARLRIDSDELESLVRSVRSKLDVSLSALLTIH